MVRLSVVQMDGPPREEHVQPWMIARVEQFPLRTRVTLFDEHETDLNVVESAEEVRRRVDEAEAAFPWFRLWMVLTAALAVGGALGEVGARFVIHAIQCTLIYQCVQWWGF